MLPQPRIPVVHCTLLLRLVEIIVIAMNFRKLTPVSPRPVARCNRSSIHPLLEEAVEVRVCFAILNFLKQPNAAFFFFFFFVYKP